MRTKINLTSPWSPDDQRSHALAYFEQISIWKKKFQLVRRKIFSFRQELIHLEWQSSLFNEFAERFLFDSFRFFDFRRLKNERFFGTGVDVDIKSDWSRIKLPASNHSLMCISSQSSFTYWSFLLCSSISIETNDELVERSIDSYGSFLIEQGNTDENKVQW